MAYLGNSPGVASQRVESAFTATASQTVFTPSSGYTLGYCDVYQNGVKLVNGDDYTAANGTTITLTTGAASGDSIVIVASFPRGLSDGYLKAEADALLAAKAADNAVVKLTGDQTVAGVKTFSSNVGVGIAPKAWGQGKAVEVGYAGHALWSYDANNLFINKGAYWDGGWKHANTSPAGAFNLYDGYFEFRSSTSTPTTNGTLTWSTPLTFNGATGNLGISGNLVLASGKGIDFSATANGPTMESEVFDDYEVGSCSFTITTNGSGTAASQYGQYVKIGRMVFLRFRILMNSGGTFTEVYASGLPFSNEWADQWNGGSLPIGDSYVYTTGSALHVRSLPTGYQYIFGQLSYRTP